MTACGLLAETARVAGTLQNDRRAPCSSSAACTDLPARNRGDCIDRVRMTSCQESIATDREVLRDWYLLRSGELRDDFLGRSREEFSVLGLEYRLDVVHKALQFADRPVHIPLVHFRYRGLEPCMQRLCLAAIQHAPAHQVFDVIT